MPAPQPRMHGLTHVPGGPDPIPGLTLGGDTLDEVILGHAPAGFWKLDEASGTVAADSSGNSLDLTSDSIPPTWGAAAGPPGTPAADFRTGTGGSSGTAGRVARSWASAITGDFTVALYVNHNADVQTNVMGQGQPGRGALGGWKLGCLSTSQSPPSRPFFNVAGVGAIYADNPLPVGTWALVAGVHDGTTWKLYVDGLLQSSTLTGTLTAAASPFSLWVGHDNWTSAVDVPQFTGSYAFVVPSALTSTDLLSIVAATSPPATAADLSAKVDRDAVETATARLVQVKLLAGDTQPAFRILGSGKHEWGQGGTTAPDTSLSRSAINELSTPGFLKTGGLSTEAGNLYLATDGPNGVIFFGATADTSLKRTSAGYLALAGGLSVTKELYIENPGVSTLYLGAVDDTQLYRASAGQLGMSCGALGNRAIVIGAADSGGAGYRMVRVAN